MASQQGPVRVELTTQAIYLFIYTTHSILTVKLYPIYLTVQYKLVLVASDSLNENYTNVVIKVKGTFYENLCKNLDNSIFSCL